MTQEDDLGFNPMAKALQDTTARYEAETSEMIDMEGKYEHFYAAEHRAQKLMEKARGMSRQELFDNGFLTPQDLDEEELRLGRCRGANGKVPQGLRRPKTMPTDLFDAMVIEHRSRTEEKLRQNMDDMLDVMIGVAKDDTAEPRERFEAGKYLFERVAGKVPDKVAVQVSSDPWEGTFKDVARITRAEHVARQRRLEGAIDAEVVEVPEAGVGRAQSRPDGQAPEWRGQADDTSAGYLPGVGEASAPRTSGSVGGQVQHHDVQRSPGEQAAGGARVAAPRIPGPANQQLAQSDEPQSVKDAWVSMLPETQFAPPIPAPSMDAPANSSSTADHHEVWQPPVAKSNSEKVREDIAAAAALAERRKLAQERIKGAKKHRKIARALGADAKVHNTIEATENGDRLSFRIQ